MDQQIDISEVIERQGKGGFLTFLLVLIASAAFLEGFDAQIQGYTAPTLTKLWHISRGSFAPVFVYFQAGFMLGAIGLGNLGDIFGRRLMIVGGVLLFGLFTIAGVLCADVPALAATRFLSAIFLGGAMPNAIALVIDYSPNARRALNVGIMYTLYTAGGACGGFLAAFLVPRFGWHSIYWVCGAAAVALSLVLMLQLPESLRYMVIRHQHRARLAATLRRLAPNTAIGADTAFFLSRASERKPWVGELFRQHRALMTAALWGAYAINLIGLIFVTSWMPSVLADAGISISHSVIATSLYQGGGAIGSIACGWLLDRRAGILRLGALCLAAAPVLVIIGHAAVLPLALLMLLVFAAGFCIVGTQTGLNALSGALYPSYLRATGSGWASGFGRIGAITGPILGGVLIGLHLPLTTIFLLVAIPSVCVAACLAIVHAARASHSGAALPLAPSR